MISNFFHTPNARKFNLRPRFYDPDKEERDNREQRIKEELGLNQVKNNINGEYRPNIKGQFRNTGGWQKSSEEGRKAQQKRLMWLFLILSLAILLIFFGDKLF